MLHRDVALRVLPDAFAEDSVVNSSANSEHQPRVKRSGGQNRRRESRTPGGRRESCRPDTMRSAAIQLNRRRNSTRSTSSVQFGRRSDWLQGSFQAGRWWPFAVSDEVLAEAPETERILSLWLNSTFGILALVGARVDTEGAWVQFKKPILAELPVLDPRQLTSSQRHRLSSAFEELSGQELLRIDQVLDDRVRLLIDDAIASVLGAEGDLASIYRLIAAEPLFQQHGEGDDDEPTLDIGKDSEDEGS